MDKVSIPDILILEETSEYLRLPVEIVLNQALKGDIPGRQIEDNWRFLKSAIDDWLRLKDSRYRDLNAARNIQREGASSLKLGDVRRSSSAIAA